MSRRARPHRRPPHAPTEDLAGWLADRRWFQRGAADVPVGVAGTTGISLGPTADAEIALVDVEPEARYQLLRRPSTGRYDAADEPHVLSALARFVAGDGEADGPDGSTVRATWSPGAARFGSKPPRPLGGEQSNTSVVVGGTHVLKLFRRLRTGVHPEVEVGRHLAAVAAEVGPARLPVAALAGWWELEEPDGSTTALGVVQSLVRGALDGWALVLSALAGDPGSVLPRLHELGGDVATLHSALAVPSASADAPHDPASSFGTEPFTAALAGTIATGVASAAAGLGLEEDLGAAVVRRATDLADVVAAAATAGQAGSAVRHHGDLHLGQVVLGDEGWVVLDFEGEPGRPLDERRKRHSPLRDVAGVLRSLSYAVATHHRSGGNGLSAGWEPSARAAFLDGYLGRVDPTLMPSSPLVTRALLELLELEKVLYEIGYEQAHRPDWASIPHGHLEEAMRA